MLPACSAPLASPVTNSIEPLAPPSAFALLSTKPPVWLLPAVLKDTLPLPADAAPPLESMTEPPEIAVW